MREMLWPEGLRSALMEGDAGVRAQAWTTGKAQNTLERAGSGASWAQRGLRREMLSRAPRQTTAAHKREQEIISMTPAMQTS